jgi:hypothetical protein
MLQSNEKSLAELFSSVFISCIFIDLGDRPGVPPVEKTLPGGPVRIRRG